MKHAQWFLELAERTQEDPREGNVASFAHVAGEDANFRQALSWAMQTGERGIALRLAYALSGYWFMRGHLREGLRWLQTTLAGTEEQPSLRAKALAQAADFARSLGDAEQAESFASESLELSRKLGDALGIARGLHELGESAMEREDFKLARALYEESIAVARQAGDPGASSMNNLADLALTEGDYLRAKVLAEEVVRLARQAGNDYGVAASLFNAASAAAQMDQSSQAEAYLKESAELSCKLGDRVGCAYCLELAAFLSARGGEGRRAVDLLCASEVLLDETGASLGPAEQRVHEQTREILERDLGQATLETAWAESRKMSSEQAMDLASHMLDRSLV